MQYNIYITMYNTLLCNTQLKKLTAKSTVRNATHSAGQNADAIHLTSSSHAQNNKQITRTHSTRHNTILHAQYTIQHTKHTPHTTHTQTHRTQHTQCTTKNAMHNSCNMQYKTRHSAAALQKQLQDSPIHCVATHSFTPQQQHIREYE